MASVLLGAVLVQLSIPADAAQLTRAADEFAVPRYVLWAVAVAESGWRGGNVARGPGRVDSAGVVRCREVGRMQLSPCIPRTFLGPFCALDRLRASLADNIRCGAALLADLRRQHGSWSVAIERYNGRGPGARAYRRKVLGLVGQFYAESVP
jgi:hypothetical protein